jgi:hypothetical protein
MIASHIETIEITAPQIPAEALETFVFQYREWQKGEVCAQEIEAARYIDALEGARAWVKRHYPAGALVRVRRARSCEPGPQLQLQAG